MYTRKSDRKAAIFVAKEEGRKNTHCMWGGVNCHFCLWCPLLVRMEINLNLHATR